MVSYALSWSMDLVGVSHRMHKVGLYPCRQPQGKTEQLCNIWRRSSTRSADNWRLVDRAMSMDLFDPRFHAQDGRFAVVSANMFSNL